MSRPLQSPPRAAAPPAWPAVPARLALAAWAALALALLFCGAMTRAVTYDEDQHIAAGVMAQVMLPYRDFAYLQAPLYPFVLAAAFGFAPGWYLLMARLVTFGCGVLSAGLLWHLVRTLGAGRALSCVLLTACLASPFLLAPLANARNDALPLTLMLAGLAAHLWAERRRAERPGSGPEAAAWAWCGRLAAALLLGLAAETKVTYAFAPAALAVHALFAPRQRLAPVLLGLCGAAVPAAWLFAEAPEAFWFGLVQYHLTAPADWYGRAGLADLLTPWARLQTLGELAALGGNLTLVVLAAALSLVAMARRRAWKRPGPLLLGLTLGALLLALAPAPGWAMYFAPVAPLLACCIAHLDRVTTHLAGAPRKRALVAVAALGMAPFLALQVAELPKLLDPSRWVGIQVHRDAQAIRGLLPPSAGGAEVATLFPLLVIDANLVRREFATGPFIFRSGGAFPPALLGRLHALSPTTLDAALDRDPPDAIYVGRYYDAWATAMDAPLAAYAERRGWRLVRTDPAGGRLFLQP